MCSVLFLIDVTAIKRIINIDERENDEINRNDRQATLAATAIVVGGLPMTAVA